MTQTTDYHMKKIYDHNKIQYIALNEHIFGGGPLDSFRKIVPDSLMKKLFADSDDNVCDKISNDNIVEFNVDNINNIKNISITYKNEKYTFKIEKIASGSFGTVYKLKTKAFLKNGKTDVVIKIFDKSAIHYQNSGMTINKTTVKNMYNKYLEINDMGINTATPCGYCKFTKGNKQKFGFFMKNTGNGFNKIPKETMENNIVIKNALIKFVDNVKTLNNDYLYMDLKMNNLTFMIKDDALNIYMIDLDGATFKSNINDSTPIEYTPGMTGIDVIVNHFDPTKYKQYETYNYIGLFSIIVSFVLNVDWDDFCLKFDFINEYDFEAKMLMTSINENRTTKIFDDVDMYVKSNEAIMKIVYMQIWMSGNVNEYNINENKYTMTHAYEKIDWKPATIKNVIKDILAETVRPKFNDDSKCGYIADLMIGMFQIDTTKRMNWDAIKEKINEIFS